MPKLADFSRELNQVVAHSEGLRFLAELEGQPIGTGALRIAGDVALLAGASTIPAARRQGAQLAMLEERLRYAAAQGCTVGMIGAQPGSGSQRNAERHGFRVAYTRIKWEDLLLRMTRIKIRIKNYEGFREAWRFLSRQD